MGLCLCVAGRGLTILPVAGLAGGRCNGCRVPGRVYVMKERHARRLAWLLLCDRSLSALGSRTDETEQLQAYSVYGYGALAEGVRIGFNGQWLYAELGGYLLGSGHRLYSPILMRFTTADDLSPFAQGGLNAYAYCAGDPVNRVDPSGRHFSLTGALKRIGVMKRTGLTQLSQESLLITGRRNGQAEIKSYRASDRFDEGFAVQKGSDIEGWRADNVRLNKELQSAQVESVFYEYLFKETVAELASEMKLHRGKDAKPDFKAAQERIFNRSMSAIRDGLPPRQSVDFGE
ncbi:RHS repeat-associated core domain-containing protein [Pseudomonas sp. SWRI51]|nr:RHS repeat-associated core domain-containing protein [Pseudomonas sp. SWRI51]